MVALGNSFEAFIYEVLGLVFLLAVQHHLGDFILVDLVPQSIRADDEIFAETVQIEFLYVWLGRDIRAIELLDLWVGIELGKFEVEIANGSGALQTAFNIDGAWIVWVRLHDVLVLGKLSTQASLLKLIGSIEPMVECVAVLILLLLIDQNCFRVA